MLEVFPILGYRTGRYHLTANPSVEFSSEGEDRGWEFSPKIKLAYEPGKGRSIGLEYHVDAGTLNNLARARRTETAYLTFDSQFAGQMINLALGNGTTNRSERLAIIIPVCLVLIAAALYMAIGNAMLTATVLTAVPLALAGGVFALALRGMPFSISSAVGFIAVSGVAVLNGLVLISAINKRVADGNEAGLAVIDGALERLRPVLMTALLASLGFVPMAIGTGTGTGAEVQKPLATVVIGGLVTSTILTLFVLPAITGLVLRRRQRRHAELSGSATGRAVSGVSGIEA